MSFAIENFIALQSKSPVVGKILRSVQAVRMIAPPMFNRKCFVMQQVNEKVEMVAR
ncbi:MAG: hypothetical protein IPG76_24295 [Acidobacteria bacterium]|nr:hypothetical protein [Acidobacteriota bacterium]